MRFTFNITLALLIIPALMAQLGHAIGSQHGVFRSQSTQGAPWSGTATIVEEEFRMTVHANYLDVELDWVFRVGGDRPAKFQDALEIVGNLNFEKSSVVVGMLTWWKGDILKGKLKTTEMARADYEDVVQRDADAPPPPRDPVLLEYGWGLDNYDISIFPATFGETRKVRIHYVIPASPTGGTLKISYPQPFSDKAKVFVRAGTDIAGYKIEAGEVAVAHKNGNFELLPTAARTSAIIPVLASEASGSRFYVGAIDQANIKGQFTQVVAMEKQKVIIQSNLKEDYVILWRWNHTRLLELYAGQIVHQSKILKSFLGKLATGNKRAALILDKEGGERITFKLSKVGDDGYRRMMAYLESLALLAVKEPPQVSGRPDYKLEADAIRAASDFESALNAAMSLFEKNENIRHLLLLTAGPQIVYGYASASSIKVDSTIQVGNMLDYAEKLDLDLSIRNEDRLLYWPGTNPSGLLSQQTLNLDIEAVVGDGNILCTLSVSSKPNQVGGYQGGKSEIEKHLFSTTALIPKISWKISQQDKTIATFDEIPQVIPLAPTLAWSKIFGASRALTPMGTALPRSLAATLGFIDSSYSLVALEEDKLAPSEASQYGSAGVPDLSSADIKAIPTDLTSLSAEDWIKENPPQRLWSYDYSFGRGGNFLFGREMVVMDMAVPGGPTVLKGNRAGAFMPMPKANELSATQNSTYPDYSQDIAAGLLQRSQAYSSKDFARVNGRSLILDLLAVNPTGEGKVELEIFSLNGKRVYSLNIRSAGAQGQLEISASDVASQSGIYLVQIKSSLGLFRQRILVP